MAATYVSGLSPLTVGVVRSFPRFRSKRFLTVRARSSEPRDGNVDDGSSSLEVSLNSRQIDCCSGENDLLLLLYGVYVQVERSYVLKLGVGSVAGAAVIKYGSVLVPQITRPNLAEALFIIITPVVAAALILLIKSRTTS
ncbi:unnamed protein product [Rhodiola kirilowii]